MITILPIDPSNNADYFYVYSGGTTWEAAATLESQKSIKDSGARDIGNSAAHYEIGDDPKLIKHPTDFASCQDIKSAYSQAPSGSYYINPSAAESVAAYCDMDYSNGGWTLIFSSQTAGGLADQTGAYNAFLSGLTPTGSMLTTWTPFASVDAIRFACDGNKNGSLEYNGTATTNGNTIYAQIKNCANGLCETGLLIDDGNKKGTTTNDAVAHPDNWVTNGTVKFWGTYDDYPYALSDNKDYCNNVKYKTRVAYPTSATTSNAYFYVFVK
jgi:hypothetical protein